MSSIIRATTTSGLQVAPDNSGSLQLQTNGTTTALTIDTSQNVGIGTTSPTLKFQVNGQVGINTGTTPGSNGSGIAIYASDFPRLSFRNSTIYMVDNDVSYNLLETGYQRWFTGNTERMRITSGGCLTIGATAPVIGTEIFSVNPTAAGWGFSIYASSSASNGIYIKYSTTPNNNGSEFFYFTDATAARAYMRSNGGLANYSANNLNLSDIREKTNIELAGSYLDKICAIPVKTFNYIDQNMEEDGGLNLGVIAQDVQAVAPELVTESNWGTVEEPKERLSIYQTDLQYALMKCIQEQQTIINDLKARIETLEAK
jgi:hypothetical protein